ncbi:MULTISPECIES: hypothetical protein [unclassified Janthinobacterium]|uniref:hypothetical protein n=1 Tax=unclassified Janthinobacterium TaxID=2610881 RepID=UPI0027129CA7|nr:MULTISPECIES: hypothetical protein [unclassified Janthinobacterium]MDO8065269.1 hypothetical protein [Janthinobacterium sp. SUN206]MDO8071626.1 hypothetical protein [Janthinobacterium sp. SUN176]
MSISDLPETIFGVIKNRFSNPLLASAFISWPFLNYKLMLVVFGEGAYSEKINFIDGKLYTFPLEYYLHVFVFPLCVGIIYWYFYPSFDEKITRYSIRKLADKMRMVLSEERKIPFDSDLQISYFKKYDEEKEVWKNALHEVNDAAANKTDVANVVIDEISNRLKFQTRVLFALQCGMTLDDSDLLKCVLLNGRISPDDRDNYKKIKNYKYYDQLKGVVKESINIKRHHGSAKRQVSMEWFKTIAPLPDGELQGFAEVLWALEVFSIVNSQPLIFAARDDMQIKQMNENFERLDAVE